MLTCNCTLCYTNPNACRSCPTYLRDSLTTAIDYGWTTDWWEFHSPQTIVLKVDEYDRNKYELVEKKDWKLKQLKEELAHYEMRLKEEDTIRLQSYERENKLRLEQIKALDELKELEKEKEK